MNRYLRIFVLLMTGAAGAMAQPAASKSARTEVLVVGVYHMANPGHDIFNMKADDVLSPKRQTEIAQVIEALKKFRPTKIAIEAEVGSDRVPKLYAEYLAGKHELSRNEVEQLGFRLAKELGHKTLYPVDADGEFPYQRVIDYAKATGRVKEHDGLMAEVGQMVKEQGEFLASHTVLETLLFMNSDEREARDVGYYYGEAHYGEPWDWAGADLLAAWFQRNMRIFSNIVQIVQSPEDRILVIYGAGHLGWLRHDFASDPAFRLRKLAEFAK